MKALLLAAGRGRRLKGLNDKPKCLLEIKGEMLIERYLNAFKRAGIEEVVIVVGYKKDRLISTINSLPFSGKIQFIENSDYSRGSVLSLWCARGEMNDDLLVMDADVYFEYEVLKRLLDSPKKNCLIMDTTSPNEGEEAMIGIRDGKVATTGRGLKGDFDVLGEWVGFMKVTKRDLPHLIELVEREVGRGNLDIGYEDVLPTYFQTVDFGYELIDGLKWVEIDFPEDVKGAERISGST